MRLYTTGSWHAHDAHNAHGPGCPGHPEHDAQEYATAPATGHAPWLALLVSRVRIYDTAVVEIRFTTSSVSESTEQNSQQVEVPIFRLLNLPLLRSRVQKKHSPYLVR